MLKDMKSHTHLKPGKKGTRRLLEQYEEREMDGYFPVFFMPDLENIGKQESVRKQ
jgi:hypothetical protein